MNYKLFDTWTEESAYFLGIISVIGEVDGATLSVNAPTVDHDWLRRVAEIVGLKKLSPGNKFSISHKQLTQPLWDMKTKHGSIAEAIPEELFQHFVRGMFDAGGNVCIHVVLIGKMRTLQKTRERLIDMGVTSDTSVITSENDAPPALKYSDSDVQKLGNFMYKGVGELCLQCKRQSFELKEKKLDVTCQLHRSRSERPECPRTSGPVLRPRTRKEPNYDSMVW